MTEIFQGVIMTAGLLWLAAIAADKLLKAYRKHERHKSRRAAQKKRMAAYAAGDRRPAPLTIAREYAAELTKPLMLPSPKPLRKATGFMSDAAAQDVIDN